MWLRTLARLVLAVFLAPVSLSTVARGQAQNATPSVADAAKQSLEKKKTAASAAKVITDDDLDAKNVKPGEEGLAAPKPQLETQPPSAEAVAATEATDAKNEKSPSDDPLKK